MRASETLLAERLISDIPIEHEDLPGAQAVQRWAGCDSPTTRCDDVILSAATVKQHEKRRRSECWVVMYERIMVSGKKERFYSSPWFDRRAAVTASNYARRTASLRALYIIHVRRTKP